MDLSRLRYMADQIAKNFAAIGHDNAVAATADHIAKFWDPRMKAAIIADDRAKLSAVAGAARERLSRGAQPPPQTRATEFDAAGTGEHSDAG